MQVTNPAGYDSHAPLRQHWGQLMQLGSIRTFLKACLDCAAMAGALLCAVLTTLIIGL